MYEVKASSPHVPACLLKEWLRELSSPLIPPDMYQPCVDLMKQEPIDPKKVGCLWSTFVLFLFLVKFCVL